MISYIWNFPQFIVAPSEDGLTDVVKGVHWEYLGVKNNYSSRLYGIVELLSPNPEDFISYENLTVDWTIDVVSQILDVPEMQIKLAQLIFQLEYPTTVNMEPPFE